MIIEKAQICDLKIILALQKLTFYSEAELYNDFSIQPLHQTLESIEAEFNNKVILKATIDKEIIGSVRAFEKDGICNIERLIVHPEHQNKGIGKSLLANIEGHFRNCTKFSLYTGYQSRKNVNLYQKAGYKIVGNTKINDNLTFLNLEKENSNL